jgi:hypothetical protein
MSRNVRVCEYLWGTPEIRLGLIRKAKDEIDRINKARMAQDDKYWEGEFQTARLRFQEAVAKYLNLDIALFFVCRYLCHSVPNSARFLSDKH